MSIIKIAVIGIIGVLISLIIKKDRPELATLVGIATMLIIFGLVLGKLQIVINTIEDISNSFGIPKTYFDILLKIIGIAYIGEFASQLCKDAGNNAVSVQIEVASKLSMLVVSLPVLRGVIESIEQLIK